MCPAEHLPTPTHACCSLERPTPCSTAAAACVHALDGATGFVNPPRLHQQFSTPVDRTNQSGKLLHQNSNRSPMHWAYQCHIINELHVLRLPSHRTNAQWNRCRPAACSPAGRMGSRSQQPTSTLPGGHRVLHCCTSNGSMGSRWRAPTAARTGCQPQLRCCRCTRPMGSHSPATTAGLLGARRGLHCCIPPHPRGSRSLATTAGPKGGRRAPHSCCMPLETTGSRSPETTAAHAGGPFLLRCSTSTHTKASRSPATTAVLLACHHALHSCTSPRPAYPGSHADPPIVTLPAAHALPGGGQLADCSGLRTTCCRVHAAALPPPHAPRLTWRAHTSCCQSGCPGPTVA